MALALLASGCTTLGSQRAEIARQRALGYELVQCKQRALDFSKTREKLLLEKQSLDVERMDLIAEIERERAGNEDMRRALEAEREARTSKEAEIQAMSGTYQSLVEQLENELRAGEIEIEELRGRLQVRALDQILFDSGSVEIKPRGREVLAKVATQLGKVSDRRVRVEGHTDDRPIATPRFPSNWELSVGRAATVARFLAEHGIAPQRLEASGFGEYSPIASNDAPEGRARNRRIEIVLAPLATPE
jgi:chemotaxis protein MotB